MVVGGGGGGIGGGGVTGCVGVATVEPTGLKTTVPGVGLFVGFAGVPVLPAVGCNGLNVG